MIIVSDKTRATTVSAEEEVCRPAAGCSRNHRESRMNCLSSGKSKKDSAKEAGSFRKVTVIRNKRELGGAKETAEKPTSGKEEGEEDVRRFKGDGLSVKMDSNNRVLVVKGDGCNVTLARNSGRIRVVGDGCRLKVEHNVGYIEYKGDGGRVLLGPRSLKERVKYVGDGGQISFNHGARNSPRSQQEDPLRKPEEYKESKRKEDANGSVKKVITTTTTTTTTVTAVQNGKKSVEKWFVDPASVISSFAGLNLKL